MIIINIGCAAGTHLRMRILVIAFVVALSSPALGGQEPARGATVTVAVYSDSEGLEAEALRAAIGAELGVRAVEPTHAGPAALSIGKLTTAWRPSRGELAVTFDDPRGRVVTRIVPAPATAEEGLRTAVMLAGNLVRDQAPSMPSTPPPIVRKPSPSPPPQVLAAPAAPAPRSAPASSVTWTGGVHPVAWVDNELAISVGVKLAARRTYVQLNASYVPTPDARNNLSPQGAYGAGLRLGLRPRIGGLFVDLDAGATALRSAATPTVFSRDYGIHGEMTSAVLVAHLARALVGIELARHMSLLAGVALDLDGIRLFGNLDPPLVLAPRLIAGLQF